MKGVASAGLLEKMSGFLRGKGEGERPGLLLGWAELEAVLPDGGLPRGVVEVAGPYALGGATCIALAAVRAAHARDGRGWCAWLDPEATLYAPGLALSGVDLSRLLVVRPPRAEVPKVAVRLSAARAFDVLVIDMDAVAGAAGAGRPAAPSRGGRAPRPRSWPSEVLVRKLALQAEESGGTVLLLTDARAPRAVPWPVALRLEVSRGEECLRVRVAKDRRGRVGGSRVIPLRTRPLGSPSLAWPVKAKPLPRPRDASPFAAVG